MRYTCAYRIAKLLIKETCRAITREHRITIVAIRPATVIVPERWPTLLDYWVADPPRLFRRISPPGYNGYRVTDDGLFLSASFK